jgi:hypothetical protein
MRTSKQPLASKKLAAKPSVRRRRRHRNRRRQRRREGFVREVAASLIPELLSPQDAIDLFCGSLTSARYALKRIRRSQLANCAPPWRSEKIPYEHIPTVLRPVPQLSCLNRSLTFPPIVPKKISVHEISVAEVLPIVRARGKTEPPHQLLDVFAVGTGLSWELSAQILLARHVIAAPFTARQIAAVKSARLFWDQYSQGRNRFASLAASGQVPRFCGDWAYFDHAELETLLPGILVPKRLQRWDYFTNYGVHGTEFGLDVYAAPGCAPLFQHQFIDRFNPLSFGSAG